MKKSLYEISTELEKLNDQLIESGGEISDESKGQLEILQTDLQVKGAGYGCVILQNRYDIDMLKAEEAKLAAKRKVIENANERLTAAIENAMIHFGIEKIETPVVKLSFRKSTRVDIIDKNMLPIDFLTTIPATTSPDKNKIKEAIKEGKTVAGAIVVDGKSLQVK